MKSDPDDARLTTRMIRPVLASLRVACSTLTDERLQFSGSLAELGVASILTMLEQNRKTGRLTLTHRHVTVAIDVVDGRLVDARSNALGGSLDEIMFAVLGWSDGWFELTSLPAAIRNPPIPRTVTQLLLDLERHDSDLPR